MDTKTGTIASLGIIAAAGIGIYFLTKNKVIYKAAKYKQAANPSLTEAEAIAEAAREAAEAALLAAQQAEWRAKVAEQAALVREQENILAGAQARAILEATAAAAAKAAQEEAIAAATRAELERREAVALKDMETQMSTALNAAQVATAAAAAADNIALQWQNIVHTAQANIATAEGELYTLMQRPRLFGIKLPGEAALQQTIANYKVTLALAISRFNDAEMAATKTRGDAILAVSKADDCVERVLSTIGDIRVLGIVVALCDRVDSIAKATRVKIAELQAMLK